MNLVQERFLFAVNVFLPGLKSFKMRFVFLKRKPISIPSKLDTSVESEHPNDTKSCIWPISCIWMVKTAHQKNVKTKIKRGYKYFLSLLIIKQMDIDLNPMFIPLSWA